MLTLILNCCCTDVHRVDFFRADSLGVDFCLLSLSFGWTFSTLAVIVWTFTGLSYSVDFDSADAHGVDFCHADFHSLDSCYTDCRSADFLLHSLLLGGLTWHKLSSCRLLLSLMESTSATLADDDFFTLTHVVCCTFTTLTYCVQS